MAMALVLREAEVRSLLAMPDAVDVLEETFRAFAQGMATNRPRTRIMLANGVMHVLAAATPELGVMGLKTYTVFREGVRFVVMLFSSQDGQLLAIIEADWLGRIRTGATSGVATKYLARPDASVVGMIGAGTQAHTQLMGVCAVRPQINTVYVYSRRLHECDMFCSQMSRERGIEVRPVASAKLAVEDADIVITATTSPEPVLFGEWLKPGCHINAIGSNWPNRREIDQLTLQRSNLIVTDSKEQALAEAGDLIIPANEGLLDWSNVSDLADVVAGTGPQRETPDDITLYKGIGIALEDIATAYQIYALARQQGIGQELNLLS
jgi:ornithine cyclodeaminase/alanine dehydrogenase-like protein (mu-crystallin family)